MIPAVKGLILGPTLALPLAHVSYGGAPVDIYRMLKCILLENFRGFDDPR